MPNCRIPKLTVLLSSLACLSAQAADDDALDLQAAEPTPAAAVPGKAPNLRLMVEVAALSGRANAAGLDKSGHRASVDIRWGQSLGNGWRAVLSDRLDDAHPVLYGQRSTRNQLREAAVSWQSNDGATSLDLGRLNVRHGSAYGYNPTDYFRDGATRSVYTADPVAVRENRVGTVQLRLGQQLSSGVGLSLALAPKLSSHGPSDDAVSLDLGSTNARHRMLLSASLKANKRWSGEVLALVDKTNGHRLGADVTGLLTDSLVLNAELSTGRTAGVASLAGTAPDSGRVTQQGALGLTWAAPGGLSLTIEAEYNGAGLTASQWQNLLVQPPLTVARFFNTSQYNQELATRRAMLIYAKQTGVAGIKPLDVTAFLRRNDIDGSHLFWAEARYHFSRTDIAIQWQQSSRKALTEYGSLPYNRVLQVVASQYF